MKKYIAIIITVIMLMASNLWAAGSCTQTLSDAADVTILQGTYDVLGGKGVNLIHATARQDVYPYSLFMTTWRYWPVTTTLTLSVANQATHSANYTIELIFVR